MFTQSISMAFISKTELCKLVRFSLNGSQFYSHLKCICMLHNSCVCMLSQINDNGVISFESHYNVRTPLSFPLSGNSKIIAPYWADVDISGTGNIYYRQTTDPSLLARATIEIRAAFPMSHNITITNLLIATWDKVGYYYWKTDKVCIVHCQT